jgi:hypothetical protein
MLADSMMDIDMVVVETPSPPCRGILILYISAIDSIRYQVAHGIARSLTVVDHNGIPKAKNVDYSKIPNIALGQFGQLGRFTVRKK